jgi:3-oxoacyl-[acyl-carrier protein] reductase
MNFDHFKNKTVVVTGAGQGIGLEICLHLDGLGCNIVFCDINKALVDEVLLLFQTEKVIGMVGDCSQEEFINLMIETAHVSFGSIDFLVANAGITTFGSFIEYQSNSLRKLMDLNIFGTFFIVQAFVKKVIQQKNEAQIVLVSSVTGHLAHKNLVAYGMTKAAIEQFAKNLVVELSPYRINVNCVAPGATLTERTKEDQAYQQTWSQITPLGSPAKIKDIADTVVFLLSSGAKHITGQTIVVDGGWTSVGVSPY